MKMKNIVRSMAFAVMATGLFVSCSKEDLSDQQGSASVSGVVESKPGQTVVQTGTIIGKITPAGKRILWLVDAGGRYLGPYATEFLTGNFRINDLPPGNYKLVIENPAVNTSSSTDVQVATVSFPVEVKAGLVTDLGSINI